MENRFFSVDQTPKFQYHSNLVLMGLYLNIYSRFKSARKFLTHLMCMIAKELCVSITTLEKIKILCQLKVSCPVIHYAFPFFTRNFTNFTTISHFAAATIFKCAICTSPCAHCFTCIILFNPLNNSSKIGTMIILS